MTPTPPTTSLNYKLLTPFIAAAIVFAIAVHFLWLPARLQEVREDVSRNQRNMIAVMKPTLELLLYSQDVQQVYAILNQVQQSTPQWVLITVTSPTGSKIYPTLGNTPEVPAEAIWFEEHLAYQNQQLGQLRIANDPSNAIRAEMQKFWTLESWLIALATMTGGFFLWLQHRLVLRPLQQLARAADGLAEDNFSARLPRANNDEMGQLVRAFAAMRQHRLDIESELRHMQECSALAQQQAEKASKLLFEGVASIAEGFTIYDEQDKLVICNEAYRSMYEDSRDLIVPGNTFEHIVRTGAERGQYQAAIGRVDDWVKTRVAQHQRANGEVLEQQLGNGGWLMIIEYRTPSGYIVGNRINITRLKQTTEDLRQRELYQRATLDNLPFMFWLKDADSRFLAVNKRFSDAHGIANPDQLLGLSDFDICPIERAQCYQMVDRQVMTERKDLLQEEMVPHFGKERWLEVFKKPVIDDNGAVLGTVGFARDITESKAMVRALAENDQRWTLALRGANDGIWDWDPIKDKVYFSERWKGILGYEAQDIQDDLIEWSGRIHPDDQEATMATLKAHLQGLTQFYQCEYRLHCKDGSYKWVQDRGQALFDDAGKPLRMAGSLTDITVRRSDEARVRDHTEQLNAIFSLSPDGFVSFDQKHLVKYANPAFMRLTGMKEKTLLGMTEKDFSIRLASMCEPHARFPDLTTLRANQATPVSENESRLSIELNTAGKRVLEVKLRVADTDTVSEILYFSDITHETEVDQMKSEFLSTAAHELRTPITSIFGYSEILLTDDFSKEETGEFLQIIHKQSERMADILNELLDLARIEARRGKDFKLVDLEVSGLINEVIQGFKTPERRDPPNRPGAWPLRWIRADHGKMIQALNNVLSNAYKYSPKGDDVTVEIHDGHLDPSTPAIGISFIDQGIGMTPNQLARVFERFFRADTSGEIPGTGLGMSIVKEITELHGGRVQVESEFNKGTTVTLWLPLIAENLLH